MPSPARHPVPARRGFTLVELLAVVAIIGMITALAVPTIFSAIASARNAKTKAEIDMLHMALMNYRNEFGSFPPANMGPTDPTKQQTGLWWDNKVNLKHPAYKHLVRVFPRLAEVQAGSNSPYRTMAKMSPAQALVFWLQGFYENPEYPLTNQGAAGTRRKLFDFEESRLYAASEYTVGTPQTFAPRGSSAAAAMSPYPVYFTGHPSCGLPYVYFDSRSYSASPAASASQSPDVAYSAQSVGGEVSAATPYITSTPPANPTWGQQHQGGETFQLIAAGRDGSYGTVQAAFPGTGPYTPRTEEWSKLVFPPVTDTAGARGHADNLTNFADRGLADAIEALTSE